MKCDSFFITSLLFYAQNAHILVLKNQDFKNHLHETVEPGMQQINVSADEAQQGLLDLSEGGDVTLHIFLNDA